MLRFGVVILVREILSKHSMEVEVKEVRIQGTGVGGMGHNVIYEA